MRSLILAALAAGLLLPPSAAGRPPTGSYSGWSGHRKAGREYYRITYTHAPGKYHHGYYYPRYRPGGKRYVYYYNPASKRYWGRLDVDSGLYQTLRPEDRGDDLGAIPEAAFEKDPATPVGTVVIPGETATLAAPPRPPD